MTPITTAQSNFISRMHGLGYSYAEIIDLQKQLSEQFYLDDSGFIHALEAMPCYAVMVQSRQWKEQRGWRDSPTHFNSRFLPSDARRLVRSRTFEGIAQAMATQWGTERGLVPVQQSLFAEAYS